MRRLLVIFSAVVASVACGAGSPQRTKRDAAAAGHRGGERDSDPAARSSARGGSGQSPDSSGADARVWLATETPETAGACERVCGRLGDCLLDSEDLHPRSASGLELDCLDMCVHSDGASPARASLLACESAESCEGVRRCADRAWPQLAEARPTQSAAEQILDDPCEVGCEWIYACMWTGQPPGEGQEPGLDAEISTCQETCQDPVAQDREFIIQIGECLQDHCSYERMNVCWENL